MNINVEDFNQEINCAYKEEYYSVRDNGAVLRHAPNNKRPRPTDNNWTFGKLNRKTGYLEIASVRIHRIVATAFHGEPPTKEHVVDHIDTNKQNNRPENLRWVTRLENVLLNPITAKRIELVCGSIEAFLTNPSKFRDKFSDPNYEWMCTVSVQEAETSKERLLSWAKSDKSLQGGSLGKWIFNRNEPNLILEESDKSLQDDSLGKWIFNQSEPNLILKKNDKSLQDDSLNKWIFKRYEPNQFVEHLEKEVELINSLTPSAVQKVRNWKTPTEFPCCPQKNNNKSITAYAANLNVGNIFSRNKYTSSIIEHFAISNDENTLWIVCKSGDENPIKPYSLAEITYQNDVFVHNSLGTFFEKKGAEKRFTLAQGLEWTGGDTIDDYC